jgi:hypothetical protein
VRNFVETTASALIIRSLPLARPDTDTRARLIVGQSAEVLGESLDRKWLFIDGPAGDGWVSRAYLRELVEVPLVVRTKWPRVPNGRKEISALFGLPCSPAAERGRVDLPASLPLSWAPAQRVTRFSCHELLVPVFTSVFTQLHARGFWNLLEDFGGCYNCREVRGTTTKTSTHSWGIGIDVNAKQNPLGARPRMPQQVIGVFSDHGFTWGGNWSRPDGMHFQYATGY